MNALLSTPDSPYVTVANAISQGNNLGVFFASSYFKNLLISELRLPMAACKRHVFHILNVISKVKMLWIHTKSHVAFVKDPFAIGNFATMDGPRKSVREDSLVVNDDEPVRIIGRRAGCGPDPTSRFSNRNELVLHSVPKTLRGIEIVLAAHSPIIRGTA